MSKRKEIQDSKRRKKFEGEESSSDEDEEMNIVNVDFEFFDPQPAIDFHGLKTLLRQLFDADAEYLDLSGLSDLILSQPLLGSTIKIDGNESDPFAFLTVLNLREHQDKQAIKDLTQYIAKQAAKSTALAPLQELLNPSSDATVGLILTERLHGMPTQLVPPMYKMLNNEIVSAIQEKEPYTFTHYLILSKTYVEVDSKLDQEDDRPKKKKRAGEGAPETFYFHPEDECLHKYALAHGTYNLAKEGSEGDADFRRAFQDSGVKPQGHMILLEASQFMPTVQALEEFVQG